MEENILQGCRQGEAWAIEALIQQEQAVIYRLCLSILDDAEDAADATQESFIAAIKAIGSFRGQSTFSTWLYAIAVNTCRQVLRRRVRRRTLDSALQMSSETFEPMHTDVEQTAIQNEQDALLWRAISDLDEKHRIPIVLRYYHDLPVAEIAHILEISEGTAHSRLSNARQRLRGIMDRHGPISEKKGVPG